MHLAWKLLNADPHGIDKADQEAKRKAKLRPAIVALHAAADKLDYLDKRLFEITLLTRLGKSADDQAAWINVVTPAIRIATADAADKLITTQRDIRSFFPKRRKTPTQPCERGGAQDTTQPCEAGGHQTTTQPCGAGGRTATRSQTKRRLAPATLATFKSLISSHFERPHCDSACSSTGVGRLFLGVGAGRAR
jgi:hypothetical protein